MTIVKHYGIVLDTRLINKLLSIDSTNNAQPCLDLLPWSYQNFYIGREEKVYTRAEPDQAETFPLLDLIPRLCPTYNPSCYKTGDPTYAYLKDVIRDMDGVLLIELIC